MAREVTITLSGAQVERVLEQASDDDFSLVRTFADLDEALDSYTEPAGSKDQYAVTLLRALLVLRAFPVGGSARRIVDVADELEISPGVTQRYAVTWVGVGLLERDTRSRRYRRPRHRASRKRGGSR